MIPGSNQNGPAPTFAQQRLVFFALLLGMTMYAIAVAVVLQQNGTGLAPDIPEAIDWVVPAVGTSLAVAALLLRGKLQHAAEQQTGDARVRTRFHAVLMPVALLEGGCLLALTVWMMTGRPVPHLVTAMVILAIAIAIVPFSDPDR